MQFSQLYGISSANYFCVNNDNIYHLIVEEDEQNIIIMYLHFNYIYFISNTYLVVNGVQSIGVYIYTQLDLWFSPISSGDNIVFADENPIFSSNNLCCL
jgi:hypothetical protein